MSLHRKDRAMLLYGNGKGSRKASGRNATLSLQIIALGPDGNLPAERNEATNL